MKGLKLGIFVLVFLLLISTASAISSEDVKVITTISPSKSYYKSGDSVLVLVTLEPKNEQYQLFTDKRFVFTTQLQHPSDQIEMWQVKVNTHLGGSRTVDSTKDFIVVDVGASAAGIDSIEITLTGEVPAIDSFTKSIHVVEFDIDGDTTVIPPINITAVNPGLFDSRINKLNEKISDTESYINSAKDYGADVSNAEDLLKEAKSLRDDAVTAKDAENYDLASSKIQDAEAKLDQATLEADKAMAKFALDKADSAIQSATSALLDAEREGASVTTLKFLLDDVKSKLNEAQDQFDNENYGKAKEMAEKAISGANVIRDEAVKMKQDAIKKKQEEEQKKLEEEKRRQEEAEKQRRMLLMIGGIGIGVIVVVIVLILIIIQRGGGGGRWDELR